jgi:hypothetical protein
MVTADLLKITHSVDNSVKGVYGRGKGANDKVEGIGENNGKRAQIVGSKVH